MTDVDRIPLAALIEAVRQEMLTAAQQGKGRPLQLEVDEVGIEVEVAVTAGKEGEAGIKIWVLTAGGTVSRQNQSTQRVSLKLSAKDEAGNRFNVRDAVGVPVPRE
jgi:hypothetical protein